MTWKQLAYEISLLDPEQQNTDVTVFVRGPDEYYPAADEIRIADAEDGVLDDKHPYLRV